MKIQNWKEMVMKVFITGATGYIGFNVARAFRRAGHQVWGLTRNENKGKLLAQQEIQPVIGNMQQPESFAEIAENCDVLIHAAADYQNDTIVLDNQTVETFLDVAKRGAHRKTIIYTSGVWVIGNTGGKTVDESTSLNPITVVAWRPDVENMVLHAAEANGVVIRPGCVYGKQGGLTGMWFDG
ncbi:MAG: NAD-dependent epimerase/dehydratase family protein, partial [Calditrichae bacterium]|nr:NAD-dependent epimerase/dehydratase family protein [Calditrichia bacterium]NIW78183.1 NAD-dependent epimerase/dehydratase family protein [Calditrichia bacterium]